MSHWKSQGLRSYLLSLTSYAPTNFLFFADAVFLVIFEIEFVGGKNSKALQKGYVVLNQMH